MVAGACLLCCLSEGVCVHRLSGGLSEKSDVSSAPCQAAITNALQNSIVFRDMSPALLAQVLLCCPSGLLQCAQ